MMLLKYLGNRKWNLDRLVLLHLYETLEMSRIDYCCIAFDFLKPMLKFLINCIYLGIRMAVEDLHCSRVDLETELLEKRRKYLGLGLISSKLFKYERLYHIYDLQHLYVLPCIGILIIKITL